MSNHEVPEFWYHQKLNDTSLFDHELAICVPPVRGDRYDFMFVQWMEFYRLMGVTKFFIYDFAPSETLSKWLLHYNSSGVIELIDFKLPSCKDLQAKGFPLGNSSCEAHSLQFDYIHYFGQLAAVQDCLYRTLGAARWTAFIDMDEFLVPRSSQAHRLVDFLNETTQSLQIPSSEFAGFEFTNVYSASCAADSNLTGIDVENLSASDKRKFNVVLHQARQRPHWGFGARSKIIVNTLLTKNIGIHFPFNFYSNRRRRKLLGKHLYKRNLHSEKIMHQKGKLSFGKPVGSFPYDMFYVTPDEVTMFHIRDEELKHNASPECQDLYQCEQYVQDPLLWTRFGRQLMDAIDAQYERVLEFEQKSSQ
eukprot:TRINITY_DN13003_c0_g1_i1.p1 TRINITY_DN13003_c0_g1~~TRINITY_DN13003_c0_g1_i1.p1  ORF type:complete len:423 (+),score=87.75 TRINITY_DN13003_c0_g1_i1:183-1271(+)